MVRTESIPALSRVERFAYAVGAVASGVKNVAFSAYLLFFYNQVVGVPAAIVSGAIALTLFSDAFVDPIIGRVSDHFRSAWGRRHPFIYGSAIPTAIFFALTWFPPDGLTDIQMGLWIFALAMLTRISISFFEINIQAMTSELSEDYTERTRLFSLRYWFLYIGQYGYSSLALILFFTATPQFPRGQLNPDSYPGFALMGAALILVTILLCGIGTHRRIPYLRQSEPVAPDTRWFDHVRATFAAFRDRAFLSVLGFGVLKFCAIGLYAATAIYFNTYLFGLTADQLAILTLESVVAATLAVPLAPRASNWLGKKWTSISFSIIGVAVSLSPLVLSYFDLFLEPGDRFLIPLLFLIGAVYATLVAIALINTSSMIADVVEENALRTGRHDAGTYFAAASFMQQSATAMGVMVSGIILQAAAFPDKAAGIEVTDAMLDSLIALYVPVVMSLWTVGSLLLLAYPISRQRHEANLARLRAGSETGQGAADAQIPDIS